MEIEEIKNIIIDLSKKIEKNPNDYNSYYNRAYYKGILKDLEGAIEDGSLCYYSLPYSAIFLPPG